jgi:coenzyme PQQ biosynthesis protein PqqD
MVSAASRPRLRSKARLRLDRKTGRHLLLAPEKGLLLNPTATAILELCTGEHSVAAIVDRLAARHGAESARVEREVTAFLGTLVDRGLVELLGGGAPADAAGVRERRA